MSTVESSREWRKNNREKSLDQNRRAQKKWYEKMKLENPEKLREISRKHYRRNIEKSRIRSRLRSQVRMGRIKKLPCSVCGNPESQGHHPDYSKPLEVIWLCATHHGLIHRKS